MKQLLFTKGPQGPIGATLGTAMNNFCSSSNKVSTHYITWLFSFWIWRRRCLKFAWFWPFGALPLGPHGGHTYYLNNFESPTPKDDSCQVWLKSNHAFSRRRWKCKKFTDDARRTTDDRRKRTAIAHSSLRLGWAKNLIHTSVQPNNMWSFNPLKTSPEYTRAGVYGKCVLKPNQIVFNGLKTYNSGVDTGFSFRGAQKDYVRVHIMNVMPKVCYGRGPGPG